MSLCDFNFCSSDVDECETVGICSQTCINRLGSYKCDCVDGYQKVISMGDPYNVFSKSHPSPWFESIFDIQDPATGRCKAQEGRPSLIFAHKTDMRKLDLDRLSFENFHRIGLFWQVEHGANFKRKHSIVMRPRLWLQKRQPILVRYNFFSETFFSNFFFWNFFSNFFSKAAPYSGL